MVIALRYVLDYTPSEIANVLDIPAATARTHLRRALDELRGSIDREEATDALAP
jgi:DNA-directed RNA polymerase specialized sigma24 family protein